MRTPGCQHGWLTQPSKKTGQGDGYRTMPFMQQLRPCECVCWAVRGRRMG